MNAFPTHRPGRRQSGFTLAELAIVLVIVGLLSGGLLMSLGALRDAQAHGETERRLNEAREALLGFAAANGRLPCPAGGNGAEALSGPGVCANYLNGYLPAITLGIAPVDANGYAIDGWGNPIRYALTAPTGAATAYSTVDGIKATWKLPALQPDLQVCASAVGAANLATSAATCPANATLTANAVAVIYSLGKNGGLPPASPDEKANIDGDRVFVSHVPSVAGSTVGEFDDMVVWLSPYVLYNRLVAAGRLP